MSQVQCWSRSHNIYMYHRTRNNLLKVLTLSSKISKNRRCRKKFAQMVNQNVDKIYTSMQAM